MVNFTLSKHTNLVKKQFYAGNSANSVLSEKWGQIVDCYGFAKTGAAGKTELLLIMWREQHSVSRIRRKMDID